jgi:hypothetical protein
MFKTKATSYLVIMLILCQSFTAVASLLDFHTLDVTHLSEVHNHHEHDGHQPHALIEPDTAQPSQNASASDDNFHNPADCHHCGHCHGSHTQWVGDSSSLKAFLVNEGHAFFYLSKVIDAPISRLLRPPKYTS